MELKLSSVYLNQFDHRECKLFGDNFCASAGKTCSMEAFDNFHDKLAPLANTRCQKMLGVAPLTPNLFINWLGDITLH